MPQSDQGVTRPRYMLIPRTIIFLREGDSYLLIKGAPTKRLWANKYNGIGGHVERGEDVLSAAQRELKEETGLTAELWLCGTVVVDVGDAGDGGDAGEIGICLYVFSGENFEGELKPSSEGTVEWVGYEALGDLPVVEDLPILLSKVHNMQRGDAPFSARSYYDQNEKLRVRFSN